MTPKEILCQWVDAFNNADVEIISELYDDNAINHQVANEPVIGKEAIKKMFEQDFSFPEMVCIVENIFEENVDSDFTKRSCIRRLVASSTLNQRGTGWSTVLEPAMVAAINPALTMSERTVSLDR